VWIAIFFIPSFAIYVFRRIIFLYDVRHVIGGFVCSSVKRVELGSYAFRQLNSSLRGYLPILVKKNVRIPEYVAPRSMKLCFTYDDVDMIPRCLPTPKYFKLFDRESYQLKR
jgi:hypothetical protein